MMPPLKNSDNSSSTLWRDIQDTVKYSGENINVYMITCACILAHIYM